MNLFQEIQQHPAVFSMVGIYLITGLIATMPPKGSAFTWETVYGWAYDSLHLWLNTSKGSEALQKMQGQNPTQSTTTIIQQETK
jgi:hypothetical protein